MKNIVLLTGLALAAPALAQFQPAQPAPPPPPQAVVPPPGPFQPRMERSWTRAQVEAQVRRQFAEMDAGRKGYVTKADVQAYMEARRTERMGLGDRPTREGRGGGMGRMGGWALSAFNFADSNGDGRVTEQEAVSAALTAFDRADVNHDGVVTAQERRAAFMAMRGLRPKGDMRTMPAQRPAD